MAVLIQLSVIIYCFTSKWAVFGTTQFWPPGIRTRLHRVLISGTPALEWLSLILSELRILNLLLLQCQYKDSKQGEMQGKARGKVIMASAQPSCVTRVCQSPNLPCGKLHLLIFLRALIPKIAGHKISPKSYFYQKVGLVRGANPQILWLFSGEQFHFGSQLGTYQDSAY